MGLLNVLVPLDGSQAAERALSMLPALQPLGDLRVRLLSVMTVEEGLSPEQEKQREEATIDYLGGIGEQTMKAYGLPVEGICRTGVPHAEVLNEAAQEDLDLVLMTSHGLTNAQPEHLGGVADKIIRGATCPILVIGPSASVPLSIRRITVPLDGSRLAAESLPVAKTFAEKMNSSLRLVQVADRPPNAEGDAIGSIAADVIESVERTALLYLSEAKLQLGTSRPVETAVLSGRPAEALLSDLAETPPDLVIMTSHGRTGFINWALGSVTDRILRGHLPTLVLRPEGTTRSRLGIPTVGHP